jgi:hypothetical protein
MNPTSNAVHNDVVLENVSIKYKNGLYIADKLAPMVRVKNQSDKYYIFDKRDSLSDLAAKRQEGTSSNREGFRLSTDSFKCEEIALSTTLSDEARDNADSVLRLETAKTNFVTDKILLRWEVLAAGIMTTSTNWANSSTPTYLWDDNGVNSSPITDIENAIDAVEAGTGHRVNKMVISKDVYKVLKHHPEIIGRMANDTMRIATLQTLRDIFDIEDIMIGDASKNTANKGQTASYSKIWTKDVWLGVVADAPALETPSALYTFVWPRDRGQIRGVRRWRDEDVHSDIIEAFMNFDMKVTGSDMGYLLEAVIS